MNAFATLIDRFNALVPAAVDTGFGAPPSPEESLIGFFQSFRPDGRTTDGRALDAVYEGLPDGPDLAERLDRLFAAAGDDRRPQGGRDAYFVVRPTVTLTPEAATSVGKSWLAGMAELARATGRSDWESHLDPIPEIRVLEGIPPKNPKLEGDKTELFKILHDQIPQLTESLVDHQEAAILRPAYYFIACDPMVRDHLMWPLYRGDQTLPGDRRLPNDPFAAYFELWIHGVRFRTYREGHLDLYLPRPSAGSRALL